MLPPRALLIVNPAEAKYGWRVFESDTTENRFLYNSNLLVSTANNFCLAGPALGAPAAGLVMEKLIVLGVREIWLISCCGTVDPALEVGDVMVPSLGVSGEGVSAYYGSEKRFRPSPKTAGFLGSILANHDQEWSTGAVWSTDAPYRESRADLLRLQEQFGVRAVDMEFSALCAVAAFREIEFAAVFVVSDELWPAVWQPEFTGDKFRTTSRRLVSLLIRAGMEMG